MSDADEIYSGVQNLLNAPDFSGVHILRCKKLKTLDLEAFSRIGKAMKKLQGIRNTIMNTCLVQQILHV